MVIVHGYVSHNQMVYPIGMGKHTLWLFNMAMETGPHMDGLWRFTYQKW